MAVTTVLGLFLLLSVNVVQGGESCSGYVDDSWFTGDTKWSNYGCSGEYKDGKGVATLVGIVIGCLAGVAAIVTVIVVICCCLRKNRAQQGQVIGGHGNTTTANVTGGSVPLNVYSTPPSEIQYGQPTGYNNTTCPQMQAKAPSQMEQNKEQQQPPHSYDHVNSN